MLELGLNASDLAGVPGTGAGGRVTVEDFEAFLRGLEQHRMTKASPMRSAVADSMRRAWSRPLATVGSPIMLDAMLAHRKKADPKPGPALYAIRALALALAENTAPAGRLIGNRIVHPRAIDIGFAVEVEDGVFVPVLREVDKTPLVKLVPTYNKLVEQARELAALEAREQEVAARLRAPEGLARRCAHTIEALWDSLNHAPLTNRLRLVADFPVGSPLLPTWAPADSPALGSAPSPSALSQSRGTSSSTRGLRPVPKRRSGPPHHPSVR